MIRRVNFRRAAEADIDEIYDYFAQQSIRLADRFVEAVRTTATRRPSRPA